MKFVPASAARREKAGFSSRTEFANPDQAIEAFRITVNDFGVGAFWRLTLYHRSPILTARSLLQKFAVAPLIMTAGVVPCFTKLLRLTSVGYVAMSST